MKYREQFYEFGMIGGSVGFMIGDFNEKRADAFRQKLKLPELDWSNAQPSSKADGCCWGHDLDRPNALIWIANRGEFWYRAEILSHEISHAVDSIMEYFDYKDGELKARLLGALVGSVLKDTKNLSLR